LFKWHNIDYGQCLNVYNIHKYPFMTLRLLQICNYCGWPSSIQINIYTLWFWFMF